MNQQVTLFFAKSLLEMKEDPRAFKKHCARVATERYRHSHPGCDADYRRAFPDKIKKTHSEFRKRNPGYSIPYTRAFRARHPDSDYKYRITHSKEITARRNINKPHRNASETARRKIDPAYRIEGVLRSRILQAICAQGTTKSNSTLSLLGVKSILEVRKYLEKQFRPGMTWKNHGPVWHIDHKRPCASFILTDPTQQKACFNYLNLQPLFVEENLSKSAKWEGK